MLNFPRKPGASDNDLHSRLAPRRGYSFGGALFRLPNQTYTAFPNICIWKKIINTLTGRLEWISNSTLMMYMVLYALMSTFMATLLAFFLMGMDLITPFPHNTFGHTFILASEMFVGMAMQMYSEEVLLCLLLTVAWYVDGERKEDIMEGSFCFVQDIELEKGTEGEEKEPRPLLAKAVVSQGRGDV